jgi:hypothetical protein
VRAEAAEGDQRGARRRRTQAAARLELQRELPRDGGREPVVALEQLHERATRQPQERRVAHRLDRRRAGCAGQEGQLADRGTRAENAERPLLAACGGDDAKPAANDDVQVVGVVAFAEHPIAREHAERAGVDSEVGESLLTRAGEQRHAGQRGPRHLCGAHRTHVRWSESTPVETTNERAGSRRPSRSHQETNRS